MKRASGPPWHVKKGGSTLTHCYEVWGEPGTNQGPHGQMQCAIARCYGPDAQGNAELINQAPNMIGAMRRARRQLREYADALNHSIRFHRPNFTVRQTRDLEKTLSKVMAAIRTIDTIFDRIGENDHA